jgi:hypothetical protein
MQNITGQGNRQWKNQLSSYMMDRAAGKAAFPALPAAQRQVKGDTCNAG